MAEIRSIQIGSTTYDLRDDTKVVKNTAITAGTNCKITYDAKGLVTAGAALTASDIPNLSADKITSGTLGTDRIPSLAASKITSGTFDIARIPTGTGASQVALGNHTHSVTLATDTGTPAITLSHNTTYKLTAGGSAVIFKLPSDSNTNYYHTPSYSSGLKIGTGTGVNDMYVPNGSTTAAGVLQIGTGATNAAAGNHNHDSTYLKLSGGNLTGHLYLTGSSPSSSTSNTSQLVFGTSSTNHVVVSSNDKILVINPTTTTTTGQILLQVGSSPSIKVNGTAVSLNGHTHSYAGSSSAGGAATSANKLNTNAGSTLQPVYFSNGVPVATSYSVAKSVPADAKFTDTTYTAATTSTDGLMSSTDKTKLNSIAVSTGTTKSVTVGSNTLTFGSNAFNSTTIPTTYAGSSSAGGTATSAAKLSNTSKVGDTNKPVYFTANGVPAAISYTIEKSVPSDAKFTDTTYSAATTTTAGLMSANDKVKLNGIATGAEVNVQSNWTQTDNTADDYIKNKPTIPATNVIPAETTANKVLLSTTTSGTAAWSSWSSAGFIKATSTGAVTIDTNSYLTTSGTAADSSKLNGQAASYYAKATDIPSAYIKSASTSGNTLTLTKQDNTTVVYTPSFIDTNQKIKAGDVIFGNNDVVNIVAGDNVTVTGLASGTGAPKITISSTYTDTGATGVTITGSGNVFSSASYDSSTRKITFTKGVTALTSHQSIKTLNTTATTTQSTNASEAIKGSGTITLHKVSKTGKYSDLIGTPTLKYQTPDYTSGLKISTGTNVNSLYIPFAAQQSGQFCLLDEDGRSVSVAQVITHVTTCFRGDTSYVTMYDGTTKLISEVKAGDSVLGYDVNKQDYCEAIVLDNLRTGEANAFDCYVFEDGTTIDIYGDDSFLIHFLSHFDDMESELTDCFSACGIKYLYTRSTEKKEHFRKIIKSTGGKDEGVAVIYKQDFYCATPTGRYCIDTSNGTCFINGLCQARKPINMLNRLVKYHKTFGPKIDSVFAGIFARYAEGADDLIPDDHIEDVTSAALLKELTENSAVIEMKKSYLNSTDYKAMKYAEEVLPEEEWLPIKAKRAEARTEINNMEARNAEIIPILKEANPCLMKEYGDKYWWVKKNRKEMLDFADLNNMLEDVREYFSQRVS